MIANKTRRDHIFEKALQLFKEKGYHGTSMRDLAQAVGIEPASLYAHLKSKEEILKSTCFEMAFAFSEAQEKVNLYNSDAASKLKYAIQLHAQLLLQFANASAVYLQEWKHLNEPDLSVFKQRRNSYEAFFVQLLNDGVANGNFEISDTKFTAKTMLSSLIWLNSIAEHQNKNQIEQLAAQVFKLFTQGILK